MIWKNRIVLVASTLFLAAACGGGDSAGDGADTEALTRDLLSQPPSDGQSTPVAADPSLAQSGERVSVSSVGFDRGLVEAPVKVLEMSDYGCGYCRQFHMETFPTIRSDFIETGMVEWKFVPFVTGMFDNSIAATEAAECAYVQSEDAFEALNSRLWEEQRAWKGSDEPEEVIRGWVSELGVDMGSFDACVAEDERLGRVASSTTLAQQLGVRGTPTFVVLGYPPLQGALPTEVFQQVLTAVHQRATQAQEGGSGPATGPRPDSGGAGADSADPGGPER